MKDQHKLIKGYRDLSQAEIDAMNAVKAEGIRLGNLIEELRANPDLDQRWVDIAEKICSKVVWLLFVPLRNRKRFKPLSICSPRSAHNAPVNF